MARRVREAPRKLFVTSSGRRFADRGLESHYRTLVHPCLRRSGRRDATAGASTRDSLLYAGTALVQVVNLDAIVGKAITLPGHGAAPGIGDGRSPLWIGDPIGFPLAGLIQRRA